MASEGPSPCRQRAVERLAGLSRHLTAASSKKDSLPVPRDQYRSQLIACRDELAAFIADIQCSPILVRLAWHDAGTYNRHVSSWPECGGANGSIIYADEIQHGANAGLSKAVMYLKPFNQKYPDISWADLIQLAGATAIEVAGGPRIPMRYGRVATNICAPEGNLPDAMAPFGDGSPNAAVHIRNVFYRMGLDDKDIVALSGAHTIGRAFKERSGTVEFGYGENKASKFTCPVHSARGGGVQGNGMAGGMSWTKEWLKFDNSYFAKEYKQDPQDLLWLPTDHALHEDRSFLVHFERYASSQVAFFNDFGHSFAKLSELGSKWAAYPLIEL